jgi:hypothetical protein
MRVQPALPAGQALERLFTPGIRLGWTFPDRNGLTAPYPESEPNPEVLHKQTAERAAAAQASYATARRWVIKPSLAFGLLLLLLAGYAEGKKNTTDGATTLAGADRDLFRAGIHRLVLVATGQDGRRRARAELPQGTGGLAAAGRRSPAGRAGSPGPGA